MQISRTQVTPARFGGDTKADLAVANFNSSNVSVLSGTDSGTFGTAVNIALGGGPCTIAAEDFDKDNRIDLVTANYSTNTISLLLNTGSSFSPAVNYTVGVSPYGLALGDCTRDGVVDLAVSNFVDGTIMPVPASGC